MQITTRFVDLEGCSNFRDLGGYPLRDGGTTRPGVLYRSDSLHRLTTSDVARLVDDLGVALAIDLRTDRERRVVGEAPVVPGLEVVHIPTVDATMQAPLERADVGSIVAGYRLMLEQAGANLAAAVDALATTDRPAVFFCMAGKDRTGLVASLVLSLAGVVDDAIVDDYHLTESVMDVIRARIELEQPGSATRWQHLSPDVLSATPATMRATLDHLTDRWGGPAGYLGAAGLAPERVDALRARLVA